MAESQGTIQKVARGIIKRLGWSLPQWTPGIGFLWPGNIILVWKTMKGNLMGPEGMLMLTIAGSCYIVTLSMGILEIWFDGGIFTTLITWAIDGFFVTWVYTRGYGGGTATQESSSKPAEEGTKESPKEGSAKTSTKPATTKK